jgi:large subunit ribosomal protein L14
MIQNNTIFRVTDNSGARRLKCIKVLGGFKRRFAYVGDLVVGSIQNVKQHKKKKIKVKEGEVCYGLVIRTRTKIYRNNFSRFSSHENAVVLMTNKKKPIATRIVGPVSKELRNTKFMRVASLSSGFV